MVKPTAAGMAHFFKVLNTIYISSKSSSNAAQKSDIPCRSRAFTQTTLTCPGHKASMPVSATTLLRPSPFVARRMQGA